MQVFSFFQESVQPIRISIEIHTRFQIPSFHVLGLPAPEIQEARERIMAAFTACGFEFPKKKVIVNLAPSAIRKSGTGHDLAIAIRVLESTIEAEWPEKLFAWGELGLDGEIKSCGRMANLIDLLLQPENSDSTLLLSPPDADAFDRYIDWRKAQALSIPKKIKLSVVSSLKEIPDSLETSPSRVSRIQVASPIRLSPRLLPLAPSLERTLEISISGRHHLLLLGPKGVGKSQCLDWFKELTPPSSADQTWTRILFEETRNQTPSFDIPIRQVHAQVKPPHLLGSYSTKGFRAGELSMAHGGLFIADEFMEWPRDAKECLREPLQSKQVILTRVLGQCTLPCDIQLIGTGNLCPCGGVPPSVRPHLRLDPNQFRCRCKPLDYQNYLQKLSGPIADRIDLIHLHTAMPQFEAATDGTLLKNKILKNQQFSKERFKVLPSQLTVETLEKNIPPQMAFETLLKRLPSLRARHKALRVAHTLQAMEQSDHLKEEHVFESISMRIMDNLE